MPQDNVVDANKPSAHQVSKNGGNFGAYLNK
jgi:hypothetical protein